MTENKLQVNNDLANALGLSDIMLPNQIINMASPILLSLNYVPLANTYKSNGFVATVVDLPVADAFRNGGFEIESDVLTPDEISELQEKMSDKNDIEVIKDCLRWGRLYGGGCILISTNQKPEAPLNPKTLYKEEMELFAVDRWQCIPNSTSLQLAESFLLQDNLMGEDGNNINYHKSRVLTYTGKTQPYFIRNQLQGWGCSVLEDVIPQLNQYLKANKVILELLDEAKIDVLKLEGLSSLLGSAGGEGAVRRRVEIASQNKNYKSMLVMDKEDEYDQKQVTFGSIDAMLEKIFLLICSCLRIPYSKIFGKGANGFSSGEDDLENYNAMIDSDIRVPCTKILKQVIDLRCYQLFGKKDDSLIIKWKPLRVLSEKEQQEMQTQKINSYVQLLQSGVLTPKQVAEHLTNDEILTLSDEDINKLKDDFEIEGFENEGFEADKIQQKV